MRIQSQLLIRSLTQLTNEHIRFVKELQSRPVTDLTKRPFDGAWNILECLEHLNRYSAYYLPAIATSLQKAHSKTSTAYTPGLLGNYFAKSIHPDTMVKKMKTPAAMNTLNASLTTQVPETFIHNQHQFLQLLQQAGTVNLGKEKTGTSLSVLIRLKLGDTLRFVAYHNERHIRQVKQLLLLQENS